MRCRFDPRRGLLARTSDLEAALAADLGGIDFDKVPVAQRPAKLHRDPALARVSRVQNTDVPDHLVTDQGAAAVGSDEACIGRQWKTQFGTRRSRAALVAEVQLEPQRLARSDRLAVGVDLQLQGAIGDNHHLRAGNRAQGSTFEHFSVESDQQIGRRATRDCWRHVNGLARTRR